MERPVPRGRTIVTGDSHEEALRDLCRCRDDARTDLMRARHRLSKMLLRRDLRYPGRAWTQPHRRWLWEPTFEHEAERSVLADYLPAIDQIGARLAELEAQLVALAGQEPYRERVGHLRCFRGIDTLSAMILLAELHGFERFPRPRGLMSYLGLVIALADRAQQRLHRRYSRMVHGRGQPVGKAVVACARELTGFVWAVLSGSSSKRPDSSAVSGWRASGKAEGRPPPPPEHGFAT